MDYAQLINETAQYVHKYMDDHDLSKLSFHNRAHIEEVVEAVKKMADYYNLDERDTAIVTLSAYFHDLGYCINGKDNHEERGAEIAEKFLHLKQVDTSIILAIRGCILATKLPQSPKDLLEEIVCDADLYHFGSDRFEARNKLMRQEAKACGYTATKEEWRKNTIKLMEAHHYHTDYGRNLLDQKKQQNIQALKQKEESEISGQEKNNRRPERGIETMFRITSTNNQRLSDMADNKSNILITVNSIILSVVIALLLRKLDNNVHLVFPTAILLFTSLITMVIAILATRPSVPNGKYTPDDLKNKKVNLLFFGNFYQMNLESYSNGMKLMMEERDYLYSTLIKDVYSQGVVLGRKFKLLRLAYNIFMYGLIVSVLAFVIVVIINA
ncbi:Pycsar system effector family protein [Sphingobacterium sp. SG20118]|uniref:Pycsar system effector family protein n=1 Tax=Sphingobacterium sp. SG20118 TaxID=3367156 RepID=UPI0037DFBE59